MKDESNKAPEDTIWDVILGVLFGIIGEIREDWIGLVSSMVFGLAFWWVIIEGYIDIRHISYWGVFGGQVGCVIMGYIIGHIFQYCCKHLKQTLMLMGVVVLLLLAVLLVKMIFFG